MGENRFSCAGGRGENFGIETSRILDACRDRDCYENVRVFLTDAGEELLARTTTVRVKCAKISAAHITVDPVQFNGGFYTVAIRFYVTLQFEACVMGCGSQELQGVAVIEKRVVLFGGESNVSVFRSEACGGFCNAPEPVCCDHNNPEAVVEVASPVVLDVKIMHTCEQSCCCCCRCCDVPTVVTDGLNGALCEETGERFLAVSLGVFSVVRLLRNGQLLISASEFCLPDKECCSTSEQDPCDTFRAIPFPVAEFCPNTSAPALTAGGTTPRSRCCGNS